MAEVKVGLEQEEWQRVIAVLAQAPWTTANPLIMKIGEQLRTSAELAANIRVADRDGAVRQ
jgi:hypothetical protein